MTRPSRLTGFLIFVAVILVYVAANLPVVALTGLLAVARKIAEPAERLLDRVSAN